MRDFSQVEYIGFEDHPELRTRIERAMPVLREEVGDAAPWVRVEWTLWWDEYGCPCIRLTLHDNIDGGEASDGFAPRNFEPPEAARLRFIRLWGDVLSRAFSSRFRAVEAAASADEV